MLNRHIYPYMYVQSAVLNIPCTVINIPSAFNPHPRWLSRLQPWGAWDLPKGQKNLASTFVSETYLEK